MFINKLKLKHLSNFEPENNLIYFIINLKGKIIYKSELFKSLNIKAKSIYDFCNINKNKWSEIIKNISSNVFAYDLLYDNKTLKCLIIKLKDNINGYIFKIYFVSNYPEVKDKILFENNNIYFIGDIFLKNLSEEDLKQLTTELNNTYENFSSDNKINKDNFFILNIDSNIYSLRLFSHANYRIIEIVSVLKESDDFILLENKLKDTLILKYDLKNKSLSNFSTNDFIKIDNNDLNTFIRETIERELLEKNQNYFNINEVNLKSININEQLFFNIEFIKKNNKVIIILCNVSQIVNSKYRILNIIDNIPLLIAKFDSHHRLNFVNNTFCEEFGKTKIEFLNSKFNPIIHEEDKLITLTNLKKLFAPPYECKFTNRILTINGWKNIEWFYKKLNYNETYEIIAIGKDISEISNYFKRIKILEEKYNLIFENSNIGIIICDKYLQIMELNKYVEELLKINKENLIGKNLMSIINTNIIEAFLKNKNLKNKIIEYSYLYNNEKYNVILEIHANKLPNNLIQFILFDVTEKFLQEKLIKEEKEKYYELFNASIDSIFIMKDDKIIDCNISSENIFHGTKDQIIGKTPYELSPKYQPDGTESETKAKNIIKLALNGFPQRFEWLHKNLNNKEFIADVSLQRFFFNNEVYLHAILRDITEEKKMKEEYLKRENLIMKSNQMLQLVLNTIPIRVYWKDQNLVFRGCNKLFARDMGFEKEEEIIGKTNNDLNLNILQPIFEDDEHVIKTNTPITNKELIIENNEEIIYLKINKIPLIEDNNVIGIIGTYEDITHVVLSEITLKKTEEKFYNIFKYSKDAIVIFDENLNIIEANDKFLEITEYSLDEIKHIKFEFLFEFSNREKFKNWIHNIMKDYYSNIFEINIKSKNGKIIPVELNGSLLEIDNKQKYFLSILRDITERKNFENEILNAIIKTEEKEREKFSKNLHDELGPLLSSIKMYINSLNMINEKDKQSYIIQQLNDLIKEAIDTTKDIANDLSPHILKNYGLQAAIESFIKKVEKHVNINFSTNITDNRFNEDVEISIYRIIKELINNTLKHSKANNVEIKLINKKKKIILDYYDNGIGFDKKILKEKIKIGMGISNIISRIKTLNGTYEIITEPEKGFKFIMEIPV